MADMNEDYDCIRVFFDDGTSTVMHVHEGDNVVAEITEMCEREGYDLLTVTDWRIEQYEK